MQPAEEKLVRPVPTWLRALFLINVILLAPQVIGLFSPDSIPFPVQLTPLNARFIGALYLAGLVAILLSGLGSDLADLRIVLFSFAIISVLVLAVTTIYWTDFSTKGFPLIWLAVYIFDPITAVAALLILRPLRPAQAGVHRLTGLFALESGVFGLGGIVLLVAPAFAAQVWPWKITPLLAQVYGAFLLAFALGALLAARESRAAAVIPTIAGTLVLAAGTLIGSVLHLDRFTPGISSVIWFAVVVLTLIAFAIALVAQARPALINRRQKWAAP